MGQGGRFQTKGWKPKSQDNSPDPLRKKITTKQIKKAPQKDKKDAKAKKAPNKPSIGGGGGKMY